VCRLRLRLWLRGGRRGLANVPAQHRRQIDVLVVRNVVDRLRRDARRLVDLSRIDLALFAMYSGATSTCSTSATSLSNAFSETNCAPSAAESAIFDVNRRIARSASSLPGIT